MSEEATVETTATDATETEVVETEETSQEGSTETTATETEKAEESSTSETGEDSAAEPKPKKAKKPAQERINELTAQMRNAERERDFYKDQIQPSAPNPATLPPRPTYDGFDENKFANEMAEWTKQSDEVTKRHNQAQQTARSQQLDEQLATSNFQTRREELKATIPDLDVIAGSVTYTDAMHSALVRVDNGPEVGYHLGKNPELAASIATLSPMRQMVEIGRIAGELSSKPAPQQKTDSDAPDPIITVGSNGVINKKIDDPTLSTAEFAAMRKKQIAARKHVGRQ